MRAYFLLLPKALSQREKTRAFNAVLVYFRHFFVISSNLSNFSSHLSNFERNNFFLIQKNLNYSKITK